MDTVDLETWVSLAALATTAVTIMGVTTRQTALLRAEVKAEFAAVRREFESTRRDLRHEIADTRGELITRMDSHHVETTGRLTVLEQRTYDLASRLAPPSPERHTG